MSGCIVLCHCISKAALFKLTAKLSAVVVGIKACYGAHKLGLCFQSESAFVFGQNTQHSNPAQKTTENKPLEKEAVLSGQVSPTRSVLRST